MTVPVGFQPVQAAPAAGVPAAPAGTLAPATGVPSGPPEFAPPKPSRTPQLLRRLQAAAALSLLVLGGVGTLLVAELRTDLESAPQLAAQYARLGEVQTLVLEASTLAAEGVVEGNAKPSDRAATAGERLGSASSLLVQAATARPQDAQQLADFTTTLTGYASALRAADGRDTRTSRALLASADRELEEQLLPGLAKFRTALATEAAASASGLAFVMPVLGLVAAVFLVWTGWVVAHLSRRVLNLGLIGALVAVLVISWVTLAAQLSSASAAGASRGAQFARVSDLTEASSQVATARRLQAQALLKQSWSGGEASAVGDALDKAQKAVDFKKGSSSLATYRKAEQEVAALMAKPDWAAAGKLALSSTDGSVSATASQFQQVVSDARLDVVTAAAAAPDEVRVGLPWQLAAVILAALVGAGLAVAGLAQRLAEYR